MSKRLREQARQERLLRDQAALKELKKHFVGYEAVPTRLSDFVKLPYAQRYNIRRRYHRVAPLLTQHYVPVTAETPKQASVLRQATHQRMRGMKHFIVHVPVGSQARVTDEGLTFTHRFPGEVRTVERYFLFPRRARGPEHMVRMLLKLLPTMPRGHYVMQTDTYGDTGPILDRGQLERSLREVLGRYDAPKYGEHRFLNRITGFRYMATTLKGARVQMSARDELRERQKVINRERREQLRREAKRRVK